MEFPALLVDFPMVRPADEPEVVQRRWPAICPVHQVMAVTPGRWSVAAGKDAVMIPRDQRAARRRRNAASSMRDFMLELAKPGNAGDRRVACQPANRFPRDGAAPFQLTRRRALEAGQ